MSKILKVCGASAILALVASASLVWTAPAWAWDNWDAYYGQGPLGPPHGFSPCINDGCGYPFLASIDGPVVVEGRGYTLDNPWPRYGGGRGW